MSRNLTPIDLSHLNNLNGWPRLIEEVKEVSTTKKPRILKVHSETLAILMSVETAVQRSHPQKRTIWTHYDPKCVKAALKTSAGAPRGVTERSCRTTRPRKHRPTVVVYALSY